MRNLLKNALFAASALAFAGSANAAVTLTLVTPGTDPYSGPAPTYNFDPGSQPVIAGGAFVSPPTQPGQYAQPWGASGMYYSVGPSTSTPGVIDLSSFGDINTLSFLWGSVDTYNTLEFLAGAVVVATFTGIDINNPANGDQSDPATNPWVLFTLTGGDESAVTAIRLTSNTNAFEIDNLAINPVPEPGTWAMMLLGFGAAGYALRRRRRSDLLPQIA